MTVHYFPIRHHGPGSAAALVAALDQLNPATVLIEGPADASDLLEALASAQMQPPVALLAYPKGEPSKAAFWPFAEFSPEYQAALWALRRGVPVRFIDLPASAGREERPDGIVQGPNDLRRDPLGRLAAAAGYLDAESWWCDLLEQNPSPGPVFAAVGEAMAELRADLETEEWEGKREAHMRLRIAEASRQTEGTVAVVCGAWHVPALQARVSVQADRLLLRGLPRTKYVMTWAPWSLNRLAFDTGYSAGVAAPGWNLHLWRTWGRAEANAIWLTRIARLLRSRGHMVPTASLIEAERLALMLATLRDRPRAGFEELREAAVACLFEGETLLWKTIEAELLLGRDVGQVPPGGQSAPLIADVQRAQRAARLKPEALDRQLAVDLRTESGRKRSALLHQLNALGVPWGVLEPTGSSRGTFREQWRLRWESEFSVVLVERVVYGSDLVGAASAYLVERIGQATDLGELAQLTGQAVTAELPAASAAGLRALEERAALTSDVSQLLASISPLAQTARYGQARQVDVGSLAVLAERLAVEAALGLRYAARNMDDAAAAALVQALRQAQAGLQLLEVEADTERVWFEALEQVAQDGSAAGFAAGAAANLLHAAERLDSDEAVALLARRLSPGTPTTWAAQFVEGFFTSAAARLIFDVPLRQALDQWIRGLDEDDFLDYLPLLRRVFAELDQMERGRLMRAVFQQSGQDPLPGRVVLANEVWRSHWEHLAPLLVGDLPGGGDWGGAAGGVGDPVLGGSPSGLLAPLPSGSQNGRTRDG
jgi:hypothetical protein